MEILETFLRVFCFPKSRINENGGNVLGMLFPFLAFFKLQPIIL